jgi:hypothetical protein
LEALREAVDTDSVLQELAQSPLMLSIMSLASQGTGGDELLGQKGGSPEERRKQIFQLYVEQMFQRKGTTSLGFPKEKTIGSLAWLARKMREHSQSVFLIEGLQPSWLGAIPKRVEYGTLVALSLGLIFGLTFGLIFELIAGLTFGLLLLVALGLGCWSESPLRNGVMSGSIGALIFGLIFGLGGPRFGALIVGPGGPLMFGVGLALAALTFGLFVGLIGGLGVGSLNHITLVETMSWKWNRFWKRTIPGSIVGLILGLIAGLIAGLRVGLKSAMLSVVLIVGLKNGLIFGAIFGLVSGLVGGFTDRVLVGKASPNQGIKLSRKNSLTGGTITEGAGGMTVYGAGERC